MVVGAIIDIVCDGNAQIGLGHIRRCQTLARQLEQNGAVVRLRVLSQDPFMSLPVGKVSDPVAQVLVIDVPYWPSRWVDVAREAGTIVVGLDWFGAIAVDVNIVIYPHREVRSRVASHVGVSFVMLRDEITSPPNRRTLNGSTNVLVLLGGGDFLGQGHISAQRLTEAGLNVTLVQGPLARDQSLAAGYKVFVNPPDLPDLLLQCDWTVTNGGTSMFESLYSHKPTYVLPQTEAEERVSASLAHTGALLGVGLSNLRAFSQGELHRAHKCCHGVIDGVGVRRVAQLVCECL